MRNRVLIMRVEAPSRDKLLYIKGFLEHAMISLNEDDLVERFKGIIWELEILTSPFTKKPVRRG